MLGKPQIQMHTFKYSKSKPISGNCMCFLDYFLGGKSHFPQCLQLLGAYDYSKFLHGVQLSNFDILSAFGYSILEDADK